MRVFIAIELNHPMKDYLHKKQQQVQKFCTRGNFTHRDNFHLTLRFLGEVQSVDLAKLKNAIDNTAEHYESFELILDRIGEFVKGNKKIIWVGVKQSEKLQMLYTRLENSLQTQGFAKELRGISPHITLGREIVVSCFERLRNDVDIDALQIPVGSISLMESTRVEGKLTYRPVYVKRFELPL